jgi:hypothetical protein
VKGGKLNDSKSSLDLIFLIFRCDLDHGCAVEVQPAFVERQNILRICVIRRFRMRLVYPQSCRAEPNATHFGTWDRWCRGDFAVAAGQMCSFLLEIPAPTRMQ